MTMLLTSLALVALTAFFMRGHLRHAPGVASGGAGPLRSCPRCNTVVSEAERICPRCRVPLQVYELVSAPVAVTTEGDVGRVHALVRADMCVGCATCAPVCPEPGAIVVRAKLATVDRDLCQGHGRCAEACPVGAIVLTTGAAVHRVEVPELSPAFETNVAGIFVVGELGGRGLIKNAVNEGKLAIEHIAAGLERQGPSADETSPYDVAIVGSGPAGLSAALEAHRLGLRYIVLEQGTLADTVRKYPRHKLLFAEPLAIPLYGDLWIADASKESLLRVWETIVEETGLRIRTNRRVDRLVRSGDLFRIGAGDFECHASRVVLAMGRRGTPRRLGVPGEELAKVVYDIAEMEEFAHRRVLVVGGGDSAIESALGLANQPGTTVHLSYRGSDFGRAKERNRTKLDAAVGSGRVTLLLGSQLREVRVEVVILEAGGAPMILPNDDVVVRIGGDAPYAFLQQLGVRIVPKDVPLAPERASAS